MKGFAFAITLVSIFLVGYGVAHSEIATECRRLNSFYVGDTVYECEIKQ